MYTWSINKDFEAWNNALSETIEECKEDAVGTHNLKPGDVIYIGECNPVEIEVSLDDVLESIEDDIYEKVGDAAEDFRFSGSGADQKKDIAIYHKYEAKLKDLVNEYLKEVNESPNFYTVDESTIKEIFI